MNMKIKTCHASFSVEAAYVFSILFFSISAAIRFAWVQRNACLAAFVLSESSARCAHAEEHYLPETAELSQINAALKNRLSSIGAFQNAASSVQKNLFEVNSSLEHDTMQLHVKQRIYSPESTMQAVTALSEFKDKTMSCRGGKHYASNTE